MNHPPVILISPCAQPAGIEMGDPAVSLSGAYTRAIADAGGLPLILPPIVSADLLAECVRRADGLLLTGGDDVSPDLRARPGRRTCAPRS